jgi:hypothetical protein
MIDKKCMWSELNRKESRQDVTMLLSEHFPIFLSTSKREYFFIVNDLLTKSHQKEITSKEPQITFFSSSNCLFGHIFFFRPTERGEQKRDRNFLRIFFVFFFFCWLLEQE